jgi:hypothetical protein
MEEWKYSFTILDFGTRWRSVISFTPWPTLPPEEGETWYPLDRRLGGPQSWFAYYEAEKNLAPARN